MTTDRRIAELNDLAAQEGLVLPLPAELIVVYELAGHVVDLVTGDVIWNGAAQRVTPSPAALCSKTVAHRGNHDRP
jgi:hypothetical protein